MSAIKASSRPWLQRSYSCPSCSTGVQCVACYLDTMTMRHIEEERELTLEGYEDA